MPIIDIDRSHPAVQLRTPRPHEIVYTLVGPREKVRFNVPPLLRGLSIRLLADLPKSGLQIHGPQWYQRYHLERNLSQPVRFGVVFEENMTAALKATFAAPALLHVFFWRSKDAEAINALCSIPTPKLAIVVDPEIGPLLLAAGFPETLIATDITSAINSIKAEARKMPSPPGFDYDQTIAANQKIAEEWRDAVIPSPQDRFNPLIPNRSQIRQVLGEYREDFWVLEENKQLDLRPAAQAAAFEAAVRTALSMVNLVLENAKWRPRMPPAIFAFPSLSPLLGDYLRAATAKAGKGSALIKNFIAMLIAEQDTATFGFTPDIRGERAEDIAPAMQMAAGELIAYVRFFDEIGYLHGSFLTSPYLRAPMKGKSISQHHSYFAPRTFSLKARQRATIRKMRALGTALTKAIDPRMLKVLVEYPEAIVGFSDLPIEWLDNDGVPLCFSHDVCRIPETVPTNLLSQFARNQSSSFEVDESIAANTLIVCGAHAGDPVEVAFNHYRNYWTERNAPWKWAYCTTLAELYDVVNKQRPQLLVFDTHGRFTGNNAGTELQFGKEFLDGNKVIEHFPQVPLVIISSCWGAPLYGCANTIAHAFFEAGSFAVTCSLLPLEVLKGANLYSRVLNNLKYASETPVHDTWASFMSHNIRTSYFDDLNIRMRARYPEGRKASDVSIARRTQWQVQTMTFDGRRKAYLEAPVAVVDCFTPEYADRVRRALDNEEFVPEFMFYSTMGRADLVQFSNWNARYSHPRDKQETFADVQAEKSKMLAGEQAPAPA